MSIQPTTDYPYPFLQVTETDIREALSLPRTVESGISLLERATGDLQDRIRQIIDTPQEQRSFDNTIIAYHRAMKEFDSVERLFRSERLIPDQAKGKTELIDRCIAVKAGIFTDTRLIEAFLSFAEQSTPTEVQTTCVKKMIHSIENVPLELLDRLKRIQLAVDQRRCAPFDYFPGHCNSKIFVGSKKEFSYLTVNLCLMIKTTTMICGGILPWEPRINAIIHRINLYDPDIIFLQEAYDEEAISALRNGFCENYSHFYDNIPMQLFGFSHQSLYPSSGLACISKFRLEASFEPYREVVNESASTPYDRLKFFGYDRNYGILHCNVMNGDHQIIARIAATHLSPFFADIRAKQMGQVIDAFNDFSASNPDIPLILCGDLNIEAGDMNEQGELLIQSFFVDNYNRTNGPTCFDYGPYWEKKWHPDRACYSTPRNWCVDRSLIWQPWAKNHPHEMRLEHIAFHNEEQPEQSLTDHAGIFTRFTY